MGRAGIRFRSLLAPAGHDLPLAAADALRPRELRGTADGARLLAALAIGVALLAVVAFGEAFVTPDSVYGMLWGRDLAHGEIPLFEDGPTPHPLPIAVGAFTAALGNQANYVATYLIFGPLSLGVLVAATFAVGRRLASPAAGVLAALLLLTSMSILGWAASARYDIMFAALVMCALARELSRPRSGPAALVLLAAAGLIRPEAWVIGGLYWLWRLRDLDRRGSVLYALLVAAGPCLWVAMDAAVTGDPLWSMHLTQSASDELYGRYSRLENLRHAGADLLGIAGPFALLVAPFALARRVRARTGSTRLVWALMLVSSGLFLALVARGMASSERYLLVPTCLIAVLAGVAAVRWREFPAALVVAAMSVLMLGILIRADAVLEVRDEIRPHAQWVRETRELAVRPDVRAMLVRCPDAAISGKLVAGWAFWGDRPLDRWQLDETGATRPDLYVAPASADVAARMLTRPRFDVDARFMVPPGLVAGPATASWRLHTAPAAGCAAPA